MKVVFIKKRALLFGLIAVILVLMCTVSSGGMNVASVYLGRVARELPIYNVQTEEDLVSISFDAAWGADKTLGIIDMCKKFDVKATFFLVGFWVEENLEVAKEIVAQGFEVGLHSNTHRDMTKLSVQEIKLEVEENRKIIKNSLGVEPKLFRMPYGAYNDKVITTIRGLGLEVIQWDVDSLDWKGLSATDIAARINSKAKRGSIILCHNNADNVIQAIQLVFESMKLKKLKFVPIGELIYESNFHIDNNGTQIKN